MKLQEQSAEKEFPVDYDKIWEELSKVPPAEMDEGLRQILKKTSKSIRD